MDVVFQEMVKRLRAGERAALCTVVASRGSTPQGAGAKMVVTQAGQLVGTLGGGCVEAEVRKRAMEMLLRGESGVMTFKLDHDYGWDDGLICGGSMEVHVMSAEGEREAARFAGMVEALSRRKGAELRIGYEMEGVKREYVEELRPEPMLVIAGAGHVGQALCRIAARAGFGVTVVDDREDFANAARFPEAGRFVVGEVEASLAGLAVDGETYVVIVTRGHRRDGRALAAVVRSAARYVGLIGSKRKVLTILGDLAREGVAEELLLKVRAPIGVEIGAITVEEIAVSIAAELIAVRRGVEVAGMRVDAELARAAMRRARGSDDTVGQK